MSIWFDNQCKWWKERERYVALARSNANAFWIRVWRGKDYLMCNN